MKTKSIITVVLFLLVAESVSASNYLKFSLSNSLIYKYTSVTESVLENNEYISKLEWKQPFNISLEIQPAVSFMNFNLFADVGVGIPVKNGTMEDFDYLTTNVNEISHYSVHELCLDKDFCCGINLSYDVKLGSFFITPCISYFYINKKFSAQDGYCQYPDISGSPWTGEEQKEYFSGNIISFEEAVYYPSCSLGLSYELKEKFKFGINGEFIFLANGYSLDSHYLRNRQYYDYYSNGFGFNTGAYFNCKIKSIEIKLDLGYDFTSFTGKSAQNAIGVTDKKFTRTEGITSKLENHTVYLRLGVEIHPFN